MAESSIYDERLLKLADHLENGKLGHKGFDFSVYNKPYGNGYDEKGCGTYGCAIGECPILFPDEWRFQDYYSSFRPVLSRHEPDNNAATLVAYSGKEFFGLDQYQYDHLFVPGEQIISTYSGMFLDEQASRYEVADNIKDFVKNWPYEKRQEIFYP